MMISPNKEVLTFINNHDEIPYDDDFIPLIWAFANKLINQGLKQEGKQNIERDH